jgi:hypothetical protein
MNAKLNNSQVASFVFGGKSIFTVRNVNTGNRFTYKMTRKKSLKEGEEDVVFVKVLSGSDNNSDYTFIGTVFGQSRYRHSPKSQFGADTQSSKAIDWVVKNINSLPSNIEVWHEGRCGRCGRKLTVPESIESGFGPECVTKRR